MVFINFVVAMDFGNYLFIVYVAMVFISVTMDAAVMCFYCMFIMYSDGVRIAMDSMWFSLHTVKMFTESRVVSLYVEREEGEVRKENNLILFLLLVVVLFFLFLYRPFPLLLFL